MTAPTPSAEAGVERWGEPPERAAVAVLAVHGRDQDPGYLREVADRIGLPKATWLGPAAPGRSWYPHPFMRPREANEPHLSAALHTLDAALARLADDGFAPERVVLLGFSQGACLLTEHLLRTPRRYAAAALLTGGFTGPAGHRPRPMGDLAGTPVLLSSSERDEWAPIARVRETAAVLSELGGRVTLRIDDDPEHHVNDATVAAVRTLLAPLVADRP